VPLGRTDGVFSMEGDVAKPPRTRPLCRQQDAMLSSMIRHGVACLAASRGTPEHF